MYPRSFLMMASLATIWAKPLLKPAQNAHHTSDSSTVISAPLTDWIKNDHTDLQWYTTISVGTPPQNFSVLIDTGSNALLLPQSNCTFCSSTQRKFDPRNSTTYISSPRGSVSLEFGTAGDTVPLSTAEGANCNWAFDDVSLPGGGSSTPVSFEFLLCYQEDDALTNQPGIDGILGLGINGTGDDHPASLQWALLEAGVLNSVVYGLYLSSGDASPAAGGELTLGGVDESKFAAGSTLEWVSLDETLATAHGQWVVDMPAIFVNGEQLLIDSNALAADIASSSSESAENTNTDTTIADTNEMVPYPQSIVQVLDSGTSFIMAPSYTVAQALYAQISPKIYQIDPVVGTWGASCADMDGLANSADISFTIDTLNVTLPSRVFNLGPYSSSLPEVCQAVVNNWVDPLYYDGKGLWELGSPLLKNYYTAWDGAALKVGFAPLPGQSLGDSGETSSSSSSSSSSSESGGKSC